MEVKDTASDELKETQEPVAEPTIVKKKSRKRSVTIFIVISIVNVALFVLLWTQLLTPAQNASSNLNSGTPTASGDVNSPLIGKPAPDFTLKRLNGNGEMRLSDLKGKSVMLNFWASWCDPCKQEAPFLEKSWETKLKAQGIVFIGIDSPEKTSDALKFLQTYGITYPNVQDTMNGGTGINYGVAGFPETVFINRQGIVVAKWIYPLTEKGLDLELKKLK